MVPRRAFLLLFQGDLYEHPEVFPQPSHTKHAPDIRIFTPHVIQSGASDLMPIDSRRSEDEPIVIAGAAGATGAASILTSALVVFALDALATAATGAATGATAFGLSPSTGAY